MFGNISIKRIYDAPSENDGVRILVDKLWPRGVSKEKASLDEWNKELPPSAELRKWFDHKPERFEAFAYKYAEELLLKTVELDRIRLLAKSDHVSLLYGAKSPTINHAVILQNILLKGVYSPKKQI